MGVLNLFGADDEARTRYLHLGKVALYQMSYIRIFGDPDENRTRVTAVKGRCLSRLTTGPYLVAAVGFEPTTNRV